MLGKKRKRDEGDLYTQVIYLIMNDLPRYIKRFQKIYPVGNQYTLRSIRLYISYKLVRLTILASRDKQEFVKLVRRSLSDIFSGTIHLIVEVRKLRPNAPKDINSACFWLALKYLTELDLYGKTISFLFTIQVKKLLETEKDILRLFNYNLSFLDYSSQIHKISSDI